MLRDEESKIVVIPYKFSKMWLWYVCTNPFEDKILRKILDLYKFLIYWKRIQSSFCKPSDRDLNVT